MIWKVVYLPEARKDIKRLSGNQRDLVWDAIDKVKTNPLPMNEGGYGKPLGNKSGTNLAGMMKVKLRGAGLRIVYKIIRTETEMLIVVIGTRAGDQVYKAAEHRMKKYGL